MKRNSLLKEELLHYINEDWNDSIRQNGSGVWQTARAIQLKLRQRGILITWPTISLRLYSLLMEGSVERISTSAGEMWKPIDDSFSIT